VKQELQRVANLLSKETPSFPPVGDSVIPEPNMPYVYCKKFSTTVEHSVISPFPKRRRLPIEIVEPTEPLASEASHFKPSADSESVRQSSSQPITSAISSSSPPTSSRSSRPGRVGGGIFRPSGDHMLFSTPIEQTVFEAPAPTPPVADSVKDTTKSPSANADHISSMDPPLSLFRFSRTWESLRSTEERWQLISVSGSFPIHIFLRAERTNFFRASPPRHYLLCSKPLWTLLSWDQYWPPSIQL
jgi:hypothetical protein